MEEHLRRLRNEGRFAGQTELVHHLFDFRSANVRRSKYDGGGCSFPSGEISSLTIHERPYLSRPVAITENVI